MSAILVYLGLGVAGIYVLSLLLHPYTQCQRCRRRGATRENGAFFSYAYRPCWYCRGRGTKQRMGASLLGIGEPRNPRPGGRFAPATKNFGKPARTRIFGIF